MGKGKNKDKKKEREKERDRRERNSWEFFDSACRLFLFRKKPEHTVMHHKIYTIYRFVFVQIIWSTLSVHSWSTNFSRILLSLSFFLFSFSLTVCICGIWYTEGQRVRRKFFCSTICKWYFRKVISRRTETFLFATVWFFRGNTLVSNFSVSSRKREIYNVWSGRRVDKEWERVQRPSFRVLCARSRYQNTITRVATAFVNILQRYFLRCLSSCHGTRGIFRIRFSLITAKVIRQPIH